jgi:hypothetical protein
LVTGDLRGLWGEGGFASEHCDFEAEVTARKLSWKDFYRLSAFSKGQPTYEHN